MPLRPFNKIPEELREWAEWCRNTDVTPGTGTVTEEMLGDNVVSNRALRDSAPYSVIGNPTGSSANPSDIASGADNTFLARRSGAVQFVTLVDADIPASIARDSDVSDAITTHLAAPDPHSQYTTSTELDAAISDHVGESDPHTQYAIESTSTFTATLTGVDASVTGTARYVKLGNFVSLTIPSLSGTSNATTCTISGLPAAIQPTNDAGYVAIGVTDNGVTVVGLAAIIAAGSVITLYPSLTGLASGWTNSGTKGFLGFILNYQIN